MTRKEAERYTLEDIEPVPADASPEDRLTEWLSAKGTATPFHYVCSVCRGKSTQLHGRKVSEKSRVCRRHPEARLVEKPTKSCYGKKLSNLVWSLLEAADQTDKAKGSAYKVFRDGCKVSVFRREA